MIAFLVYDDNEVEKRDFETCPKYLRMAATKAPSGRCYEIAPDENLQVHYTVFRKFNGITARGEQFFFYARETTSAERLHILARLIVSKFWRS